MGTASSGRPRNTWTLMSVFCQKGSVWWECRGLPWHGAQHWNRTAGLCCLDLQSCISNLSRVQVGREADGSCLLPLGREVCAGSGKEAVKPSSLHVTHSLTTSVMCHWGLGSLVVIVAQARDCPKFLFAPTRKRCCVWLNASFCKYT